MSNAETPPTSTQHYEDEYYNDNPLTELYTPKGAAIETIDKILPEESDDQTAVEVVAVGRSGKHEGKYLRANRSTRQVEITPPDEAFLLPRVYTVDLINAGQDTCAYVRCQEGDYYESVFVFSDGASSVGNHTHQEIVSASRGAVSAGVRYCLSKTSQTQHFEGPNGLQKLILDVRDTLPADAGAATFTICGIRKDSKTGRRFLEYSSVGNDQIMLLSETNTGVEAEKLLIPADAAQFIVQQDKLISPNVTTLTPEMEAARETAIQAYTRRKQKNTGQKLSHEQAVDEATNQMVALLYPRSVDKDTNDTWMRRFKAFVNTGSVPLEPYLAGDRKHVQMVISTDTHAKDVGPQQMLRDYERRGKQSPRIMANMLDIAHWRLAKEGFNNDSLALVAALTPEHIHAETKPPPLEPVRLPPSDKFTTISSLERSKLPLQVLNYAIHALQREPVDPNNAKQVASYVESSEISDEAADAYRRALAESLLSTALGHYLDIRVEYVDEAAQIEIPLAREVPKPYDVTDTSFSVGEPSALILIRIRRVGYTDKSEDTVVYNITASKIQEFPRYI